MLCAEVNGVFMVNAVCKSVRYEEHLNDSIGRSRRQLIGVLV